MTEPSARPRRGCSGVLGVSLVVLGVLLLLSNYTDFSLVAACVQVIDGFSLYWPGLLILWGVIKLYQRFANPEGARVGAGEIILLVFLVLAGTVASVARRAMDGFHLDVGFEELAELMGAEVLGPARIFTEENSFDIAEGTTSLVIDNRRGSVNVTGWDEPGVAVTLTKRIFGRSEDEASRLAEGLRLDFQSGIEARLVVQAEERNSWMQTDLEIRLPRALPLTIRNRRGPVRVSELRAAVDISSSEDPIEVRDVHGNVRVETRHGSLRVEGITGDVDLNNRHASTTVKRVEGGLRVESANGPLVIEDVTGTTILRNRHSRLRASRIGGDLDIEAVHTEVWVEDAGADARLKTTYRPIFVRRVQGRLTIEGRSSEIEARDITGDSEITNLYRTVAVSGVAGSLRIDGRQCPVRVADVAGAVEIDSSDHRVTVRGISGPLRIVSRHAPLNVSSTSLSGELHLQTTYGDIRLELPPDASFGLTARISDGTLRSDFETSSWSRHREGDVETWEGTQGSGGSRVSIETSHGNVAISRGGRP